MENSARATDHGPRTTDEIIVGGQAVIEGVMMRSPNAYAVSVRRPDGQIVSTGAVVPRYGDQLPILKRPVIRGAATLIQSLALGIKALNFSAAVAMEEEAEEIAVGATAVGQVAVRVPARREKASPGTLLPLLFALAFNLVLFVVVPLVATNAIFALAGEGWVSPEPGATWYATAWAWGAALLHSVRPTVGFNLVEGVIRIGIFLALIWSMSRVGEIRRVFEYHGAEHKVVMAYENRLGLSVEAARTQPRFHPRCGTSFLMVVMLVAVALFSVVRFDTLALNAVARIALFPLVAGLSYEVIRAAGRKQSGLVFKAMVAPGLWLQRVTTKEPSDDQLEVAVHALQASLALEPDSPSSVVRGPLLAQEG
jgi:uncharacterized protein YqhQ